jgi:hypothetical protein
MKETGMEKDGLKNQNGKTRMFSFFGGLQKMHSV